MAHLRWVFETLLFSLVSGIPCGDRNIQYSPLGVDCQILSLRPANPLPAESAGGRLDNLIHLDKIQSTPLEKDCVLSIED